MTSFRLQMHKPNSSAGLERKGLSYLISILFVNYPQNFILEWLVSVWDMWDQASHAGRPSRMVVTADMQVLQQLQDYGPEGYICNEYSCPFSDSRAPPLTVIRSWSDICMTCCPRRDIWTPQRRQDGRAGELCFSNGFLQILRIEVITSSFRLCS